MGGLCGTRQDGHVEIRSRLAHSGSVDVINYSYGDGGIYDGDGGFDGIYVGDGVSVNDIYDGDGDACSKRWLTWEKQLQYSPTQISTKTRSKVNI